LALGVSARIVTCGGTGRIFSRHRGIVTHQISLIFTCFSIVEDDTGWRGPRDANGHGTGCVGGSVVLCTQNFNFDLLTFTFLLDSYVFFYSGGRHGVYGPRASRWARVVRKIWWYDAVRIQIERFQISEKLYCYLVMGSSATFAAHCAFSRTFPAEIPISRFSKNRSVRKISGRATLLIIDGITKPVKFAAEIIIACFKM